MTDAVRVLLTSSEIAELAGVTRAAVTNWRKRPSDPPFPQPVPGFGAKLLYDREQVIAWLAATKPEIQIQRDNGEAALSYSLNALRGRVAVPMLGEFALALCCAKRLSTDAADEAWAQVVTAGPSEVADVLHETARNLAATDEGWADVLATFDDIDHHTAGRLATLPVAAIVSAVDGISSPNLAGAADGMLQRGGGERGRAAGRGAGEHGAVGSRISELLSNLASSAKGVVYDPACGIGETLVRSAAKRAGKAQVVGQDIDARAIRIARMRCVLHGIDANFTAGDVLFEDPDPTVRADAVVIEPPFGSDWSRSQNIADVRWIFGVPPASSSELAWLQHAIAHLAPDGSAYVVTSVSPLTARGNSAAIRAGLLRSGWVEAVILLPPKMLLHTAIPVALWVLRQAEHPSPDLSVLLIDASETANPETLAASWLSLGEGGGDLSDAPPHALVETLDLLADDARLDPRRWMQTPGSDPEHVATRLADSQRVLGSSFSALLDHAGLPTVYGRYGTPRVLTVKELVQLGVVSIQNGRARPDDVDEEDAAFLVTPKEVRDGLAALPEVDAARSPQSSGRDERSLPGDILATTWNVVRAVVDEQGGHIIGNGVHRLRVDENQCNPHYVARFLQGSWNERFRQGTTIQRVDLRDLEVPMLPIPKQEQLVKALGEIENLARLATEVADAAAATASALLDAVRYDAPIGADQ